ncbi:hypothetical protein PPSIR1_36597 [Plesiocystis pacifica SIR-1]|uniref:Uncharacterized protein n=1 Tax=Plesiocystis pacifica SIR-1 TaxID=391625 RepID=A6G1M4_9BACT|nr:hypothetical protein [Plesiocystis pacifica]EDM80288.1 hypothetical protein PPSIR1_36597 [Plesiocystis pacifica SIR-1]
MALRLLVLAVMVSMVALVMVAAPGRAHAGAPQGAVGNPATQVPRVADGPGRKVGKNSTFHGGAALAIGFDSNVFSESRASSPVRAAYGLPSAWLSIGNRQLRAGVLDTPPKASGRKADYYLGVITGWRLYMSGQPTVWQASKFNIGLNLRTMFAPGRHFSVGIQNDLYRLGEPTNFQAAREFNFNRISNSAKLHFILRPSGGRFSLDVGYRNQLLVFENGDFFRSNRLVNGLETETKYRLRDRTAFAIRYDYHYTYYFCCTDLGVGRNEDSHAHRVLGGFSGQLGDKVVLDAFAGAGFGLYKQDRSGPDFDSFIGYVALGWFPSSKTQIGLRLGREFNDSLWGNYYTDIGGSLSAGHVFKWNMRLDAGFGVYGRRYAGLPIPGEDTQDITSYVAADGFVRRDTLISLNVQLEQALGKYFVVGGRYALGADLTDFQVTYSNGFTQAGRFNRSLLMVFGAVRY